jgi:hypothetical protein
MLQGSKHCFEKCYRSYAELARRHHTGLVLGTATWRASAVWDAKLEYGQRHHAVL